MGKKEKKDQVVAGMEYPPDLEFSRETVWVLENLSRTGAVVFEPDDGYHPEIRELEVASKYGYFYMFQCGRAYILVDADKFRLGVMASEE